MTDVFTKHHAVIKRAASNFFPVKEDAEDAMQEAYLKLSGLEFVDIENEPGLVHTIASNLFRDLYRKSQRLKELDQYAAVEVDVDDSDPCSLLEQETQEDEAGKRLDDLPDELKETASMYYLQAMSYKDIADRLSIPEGTVASRMSTARKYLAGE